MFGVFRHSGSSYGKQSLVHVVPLMIRPLFLIKSRSQRFFERYSRMVAIVQLQRRIAGVYIFCVIVRKLGHWQEFCLVILIKIDDNSEVDLYNVVLLFCLIVSLWIKDGR